MNKTNTKSSLIIVISIVALAAIGVATYLQQNYSIAIQETNSLNTQLQEVAEQNEQKIRDLKIVYDLLRELDNLKLNLAFISGEQSLNNKEIYDSYYIDAREELRESNDELIRIYKTYMNHTIEYDEAVISIFGWINISTIYKPLDQDSFFETAEMIDELIKEIEGVRDSILEQ